MTAGYTANMRHDSQRSGCDWAAWPCATASSCTASTTGRRPCATPDGELRVASGRKPELPQALLAVPGVRGVLRVAEVGYLLPIMRRRLPEARLPIEGAGTRGRAGRHRCCCAARSAAAGWRR